MRTAARGCDARDFSSPGHARADDRPQSLGRGALRMYCAAIGIALGYLLGRRPGLRIRAPWRSYRCRAAAGMARRDGRSFHPSCRACHSVHGRGADLRAAPMGDITAAQKQRSRMDRLDIGSIRNGIVANGAATMLAALPAGSAAAPNQSSIGSRTRSVSHRGGSHTGSARCDRAVGLSGRRGGSGGDAAPDRRASLLFTSCFVIVSGCRSSPAVCSIRGGPRGRPRLDPEPRYDLLPQNASRLPPMLQPFAGSGLAIGLITALVLNAYSALACAAAPDDDRVRRARARCDPRFHRTARAHNGARAATIVERAIFGTAEAPRASGTLPYTRSALHRGVLRRVQPRISG